MSNMNGGGQEEASGISLEGRGSPRQDFSRKWLGQYQVMVAADSHMRACIGILVGALVTLLYR